MTGGRGRFGIDGAYTNDCQHPCRVRLAPVKLSIVGRQGLRGEGLLGMGSYLTRKLLVHCSVRVLHRLRLRPCQRTTHGPVLCELKGGDRCVPLYVMLETEFASACRAFLLAAVLEGAAVAQFLGIPWLPRRLNHLASATAARTQRNGILR